jgi:hypothetical protein
MKKCGRLSGSISQLCYNHALHNSVVSVCYNTAKKKDDVEEMMEATDESESDIDQQNVNDMFFAEPDEIYEENPSLKETIGLTRKTVKFFKNSSVRKDLLEKHVIREFGKKLNLKLDVRTRWSSLQKMIERFLQLEEPIKNTLNELGNPPLPEDHFVLLRVLNNTLSPAVRVTNELSKRDSNLLKAEGAINYLFSSLKNEKSNVAQDLLSTTKKKILERRNVQVVSVLYFLQHFNKCRILQ